MDRKEAVKCLRQVLRWSMEWDDRDDGLEYYDAIEMAIAALSQPNEPLTCDGCNMQGERVSPCSSCIRDPRVCDYYDRRPPEGVVRCRECKYWLGEHVCDLDCNHETHTGPDDFCSRGQRKEADHEVSGP